MQFIDQVKINVQAGDGGDGLVTFRREKFVPTGGPSGGNGGNGGSVHLVANPQLQTLLDFKFKQLYKAETGERGGPKGMTGACGEDLILQVPCGTSVYNDVTGAFLGDLLIQGDSIMVAKGGKGGLGNKHFLSNSNRAPETCLPGMRGEEFSLRFELKLIAEVGILGMPNAGKSTLISVLSSAKPKIADYPFTTLVPNLGVVRKDTGDGTVFADIPGLIEGAHEGIGLGHDFLRHVERTRLLIHLVDGTDPNPVENYTTIQRELKSYGRHLYDRPQIVAINKIDSLDQDLREILVEELQEACGSEVLLVSAVTKTGLKPFLQKVWDKLDELDAQAPKPVVDADELPVDRVDLPESLFAPQAPVSS